MSPQTPQMLYSAVRTTSPEDSITSSPSSPHYLRPSPIPKRIRPRMTHLFLLLSLCGLATLPFLYSGKSHISSLFASDISVQHVPSASGGLPDHLNVPLTLEARLSYLLGRPALHQWEAELGSRHACPFYTYSRNTYFFHDGKPEQWERIGPIEIRRYRSKMVDYLRGVEREGGKLVWDQSMEVDVPVEDRRGIILTGNEGVSQHSSLDLFEVS